MMSGDTQTDPPIEVDLKAIAGLGKADSKKKKKKKKLSAADKALAKIEKKADDLKKNGAEYNTFIDRVEKWLNRYNTKSRVIRILQQFDHHDEHTISYESFKAAMLDVNVPCNSVELHLMATLLDLDNNQQVHYHELENGLQISRTKQENYSEEDAKPTLPLTYKDYKRCSKCKLITYDGENFRNKYPRYLEVNLRLLRFAKEEHPSHVTCVVESHVTMCSLIAIIKKETDTIATKFYIYNDPDDKTEISLDRRLEDDYVGGTVDNPTQVTLYYDFESEFFDCPLLMCDYTIRLKDKSSTVEWPEEMKTSSRSVKKEL